MLANPHVEDILNELIELKKEKKISYVESQSGFDGRILINRPYLAKMLKDAGFKNPKIAWDGPYGEWKDIKKQLDILVEGGFKSKEISVFMLYNHDLDYNIMESKRVKCFEWQVQITDCRFRPLDQLKMIIIHIKEMGNLKEIILFMINGQIKQFVNLEEM